jgi:4-amino-4-deoxy-L-arabinose transferase-like glycosyltransferase
MLQDKSWLVIHWLGVSYLDKPPLLFWMAATSFKLFGINHFTYRLPSFLIMLLGVYSTWKLTKRLYTHETANLAALILFSTQGIFLMAHDVRTDSMLLGWVAFSCWQIYLYLEQKQKLNFILGFLGIGFAMLTKGPIGFMIPVLAFGPQLLIQRRWSDIFRWEWLLGIVIIFIVLAPMLYGLWIQHGEEGIHFYFWKQSFGRLTGENVWRDDTGPLFFTHSFLWSFLPWTLPALYGMAHHAIEIFRKPKTTISSHFWAIIFVFIAISNAYFKLPHYFFVVYPFISMLTAAGIMRINGNKLKYGIVAQAFTVILIGIGIILLMYVDFTFRTLLSIIVIIAIISTALYFLKMAGWPLKSKWVSFSLLAILSANVLLNIQFYPILLGYQAGSAIGTEVKRIGLPTEKMCFFRQHRPSFDFYSQSLVPNYFEMQQIDSAMNKQSKLFVFTNQSGLDTLRLTNYIIDSLHVYPEYKATKLTLGYLFPEKRPQLLNKVYYFRLHK